MKDTVFISYAREDKGVAERLYMDLRKNEINAWIDSKCLLPGERWENMITKTIKESAFFILLISRHSVTKRGFVQKEIKQALRALEEFPSDQIFLIPARLDDTIPVDEELQNLNWVELSASYTKGLRRILTVLAKVEKEPLQYVDMQKTTARRAPIEYRPFQDSADFIKQLIEKLPVSTIFSDLECPYYITFLTDPGMTHLPDYLRKQYPERMTLVLQYQYESLTLFPTAFSIILAFKGKRENISISYDAVLNLSIPEVGIEVINRKAEQVASGNRLRGI